MYPVNWLLEEIEGNLLQALEGIRQMSNPTSGQRRHRLDVLLLLYKVRHLRKRMALGIQGRLN